MKPLLKLFLRVKLLKSPDHKPTEISLSSPPSLSLSDREIHHVMIYAGRHNACPHCELAVDVSMSNKVWLFRAKQQRVFSADVCVCVCCLIRIKASGLSQWQRSYSAESPCRMRCQSNWTANRGFFLPGRGTTVPPFPSWQTAVLPLNVPNTSATSFPIIHSCLWSIINCHG